MLFDDPEDPRSVNDYTTSDRCTECGLNLLDATCGRICSVCTDLLCEDCFPATLEVCLACGEFAGEEDEL